MDTATQTTSVGITPDETDFSQDVLRPGPKFTAAQREEVIEKVGFLARRGYSYQRIADKLKEQFRIEISHATARNYVLEIRRRYAQESQADLKAYRREKLIQYAEIRAELFEAWEFSKEVARKKVTESEAAPPPEANSSTTTTGDSEISATKKRRPKANGSFFEAMVRVKEIVTEEGRIPHHPYMTLIMQTLEAERELLGLDLEEKTGDTHVTFMNLDWSRLAIKPEIQDPFDAKVAEVSGISMLPPTPRSEESP